MLLKIISNRWQEKVDEAITENEIMVFESLIVDKFDIAAYLKQQLEHLQGIKLLLLDLSCLMNSDEETIGVLSQFRMIHDQVRIIIIAPGRDQGDHMLSEVFSLGIYDIIAYPDEPDGYWLKREVAHCLTTGKSYRESIGYKILSGIPADKSGKKDGPKERLIIKSEIRQNYNKAQIGFVGTQSRIGTTHQCIVFGLYLAKKGYRVALVEHSENTNKSFVSIQEGYEGVESVSGYFRLNGMDFYPNYDIHEIAAVHNKNYNFVLIDFGVYHPDYLSEMRRCVKQLVVAGSKPWEQDKMTTIFTTVSKDELQNFLFLFNFTAKENEKGVRKGMDGLQVYFAGYVPEPLQGDSYSDMEKIMQDFGFSVVTKKEERSTGKKAWEAIKHVWKKN